MPDIVTITPNPAVDLSTSVEKILPTRKLRGMSQRRDPGGGGVNVARVVKRLGGQASAIYPVGGGMGALLQELLDGEGVASRTFAIADQTREDFFVSETGTGRQYRFILPGPRLNEAEWQECLKLVSSIEPFPRFDSFRQAVAAGAAALLNPGTELCRPHDVERLAYSRHWKSPQLAAFISSGDST